MVYSFLNAIAQLRIIIFETETNYLFQGLGWSSRVVLAQWPTKLFGQFQTKRYFGIFCRLFKQLDDYTAEWHQVARARVPFQYRHPSCVHHSKNRSHWGLFRARCQRERLQISSRLVETHLNSLGQISSRLVETHLNSLGPAVSQRRRGRGRLSRPFLIFISCRFCLCPIQRYFPGPVVEQRQHRFVGGFVWQQCRFQRLSKASRTVFSTF